MGVGLSCLGGQSSSSTGTQEKLMKQPACSNKPEDGTTCSSSVLDFFKSGCFSARDHQAAGCSRNNHHDDDEAMKMKMQRSLGDWLAEPSPTSGRTTFGSSRESFIFMSFSKKVHPSSSVNPRGSFSKEKLLKNENTGEEDGLGSQSKKKLKKKVSFSLPEDNEVIILPPSPESEEEEVKEDES